MSIAKDTIEYAKNTPKKTWLIATILPGGLISVGLFLISKSIYKTFKNKKSNKSK